MKDFTIIYKILKALQISMQIDDFDPEVISAKFLDINREQWEQIITMLVKNEYIEGVSIKNYWHAPASISMKRPKITLKGLEYLASNPIMIKESNTAQGILEIIQ
ncbi:hypothetical protein FACS1894105_13120 [Clostridia bacterium]|nr:hypothetical protein FACS1894105_13120 [Clostridia bacterium]